ncbi:MAG: RagB/SusD family nutrient uptake outer membrane protein [Bacteroidales bacterium]|nr:RagB/SusD family nutrient uptake outer membrane protein [Bacteroidales bacterium]
MKINFKYLVLIIFVGLISNKCQKSFLDTEPADKIISTSFYNTQKDAELAINAAYAPLRSAFDRIDDSLLETATDNGIGEEGSQNNWVIYSDNNFVVPFWNNLYQGILYTNIAIIKIPDIDMPETAKSKLLAEARFLRGFYYFNLVTNFGGVPLILEPRTAEDLEMPRESIENVVKQIIDDLEYAQNNLPSVTSFRGTVNLGRATKGAAKGFLARTYLWIEDWQKCAQLTSEIIISNEYKLMPAYADNFIQKNDNNLESLFEVQFQIGVPENVGSMYSCYMGPRGNPRTTCNYGSLEARQELLNTYEAGDLRRKATIYMEGDEFFGIPYDPTWSGTGLSPAKWLVSKEDGEGQQSATNQQLMRYAEVLLNNAEANFMLGKKNDALLSINKVRNRAGLNDLTLEELTFDAIFRERRIELAFEGGHRLFDLRRSGLAEAILTQLGYPYDDDIHNVFPIPLAELDANPAMVQNPGY